MSDKPLAEKLRPKKVSDYIGQQHLMGEGAILRTAIESDRLHSMILWGPPGVGKTTLALLIAETTGANFYMLSAISSGVKEIREVIDSARNSLGKSILFIDEIHRFSKAQQDSLLGAVEQGVVTLIGATTENPSFEVISPLLSRCQVYILKSLEENDLQIIIKNCVSYLEQDLNCKIKIDEDSALLRISGGDARKLINAVELVVTTLRNNSDKILINNEIVLKIIQKNLAVYDKKGENHYDIISAFIKSVRGSDPNAAVYWLARMLEAGEDPLFIARRLIILASEDVGNANPNALLLANSCFQAVHQIGMPEARIVLSQTTTYLASSPKSNAAYMAVENAFGMIKSTGDLPVPLHLRNAPTRLMKDIGYAKDYKYSHDFENHFVDEEFLPESISGAKFYEPQDNPRENELRKYLKKCWKDKYRYVILLVSILTFFTNIFAQDIHYSQFSTSAQNLNPALTGVVNGVFRAGLNQRTQWLSVTKPFLTFSAAIDAPVYKNNRRRELVGLGFLLNVDRAGDSHYTSCQPLLSASYVKSLDHKNNHKIGFGAYAALINRSINFSRLSFDEQWVNGYYSQDNPITENLEKQKITFFDWGIGVNYSFVPSDKFSLITGVGISHLNTPKQTYYKDENSVLPIKSTAYIMTQVLVHKDVYLCPMVYAAFQGNFTEINFGCMAEYQYHKNAYTNNWAFGGGIFCRWADAVIATATLRWQNVKLGISYDFNYSSLVRASRVRGGLEISLLYVLKRATVKSVGNEPCPFLLM